MKKEQVVNFFGLVSDVQETHDLKILPLPQNVIDYLLDEDTLVVSGSDHNTQQTYTNNSDSDVEEDIQNINMSERHRALPSWMAKKEEKVKEREPLRSGRKRKTARAAFYCMNEKELVEAAVSYLTNGACKDVAPLSDHKVEDKAVDIRVKVRADPATSKRTAKPVTSEEEFPDCGDAAETTYVSETDLDITEEDTKSLQHQGPEGQMSGPLQDHSGLVNAGLEAEEKEELSQVPAKAAEEDDALRLVREIFFT